MATTIVALFKGREDAETAVHALLAAKFTTGDIDTAVAVDPDAEGDLAAAVRGGAAIVAVRALGATGEGARAILTEAGALQIDERAFSWDEQGWEGFEIAPSDVEVKSIAETRNAYRAMNAGKSRESRRMEEDEDRG